MALRAWSERDFESLSWHDDHVHAVEIREGEDGAGELILHLDHIVEWLGDADGRFSFRVAPARLTFHAIFGLKMALDYATVSAGIMPFSIGGITREATGQAQNYRWHIAMNWPAGSISFDGARFTQQLLAEPILTASQCLEASVRAAMIR